MNAGTHLEHPRVSCI